MSACPRSACPHFVGQGCACPASQADPDDIPDVIDMRDNDRHHYPDLYVEPVPVEAS